MAVHISTGRITAISLSAFLGLAAAAGGVDHFMSRPAGEAEFAALYENKAAVPSLTVQSSPVSKLALLRSQAEIAHRAAAEPVAARPQVSADAPATLAAVRPLVPVEPPVEPPVMVAVPEPQVTVAVPEIPAAITASERLVTISMPEIPAAVAAPKPVDTVVAAESPVAAPEPLVTVVAAETPVAVAVPEIPAAITASERLATISMPEIPAAELAPEASVTVAVVETPDRLTVVEPQAEIAAVEPSVTVTAPEPPVMVAVPRAPATHAAPEPPAKLQGVEPAVTPVVAERRINLARLVIEPQESVEPRDLAVSVSRPKNMAPIPTRAPRAADIGSHASRIARLFEKAAEIDVKRDASVYLASRNIPANDRLLKAYSADAPGSGGIRTRAAETPGLVGIATQAESYKLAENYKLRDQSDQTFSLADAMRDAIWRKNTAARLKYIATSQSACADGMVEPAHYLGLGSGC